MFDFEPNGPPFYGCKALPRVSNMDTIHKYVGFALGLIPVCDCHLCVVFD
jgi:hypothetical protein